MDLPSILFLLWDFFLMVFMESAVKSTFYGTFRDGSDGSRTRVQKPIPCPSTIIVSQCSFPPPDGDWHSSGFGSFIIRPQAQSFACVVSCIVDAWVLRCRCPKSDSCH